MKSLRDAILSLLDYTWKDEQKHWDEIERPENHIYQDLIVIRDNFGLQEEYPIHKDSD